MGASQTQRRRTPHLSNLLGVNLQLLLELTDGSVLLLELLHQILEQTEGRKKKREVGIVRADLE